jgi:hypothetical protein
VSRPSGPNNELDGYRQSKTDKVKNRASKKREGEKANSPAGKAGKRKCREKSKIKKKTERKRRKGGEV